MSEPTTRRIDLDDIEARHRPAVNPPTGTDYCAHCLDDWPCDALRALDGVDGKPVGGVEHVR